MGVKGLRSFIKKYHPGTLKSCIIQNCKIVIDGKNLAYLLYENEKTLSEDVFGDYDKYAEVVNNFFET